MASSAEHISAFELPKEYLHVGVAVYNNIYHFYQSGIVISPQMVSIKLSIKLILR
jgi:hypothetical protein